MKRVMIIGQPGSGKSWLARRLGEITGLPVTHVDHIQWMSGWVERTRAEKIEMAREIEMQESWIFEGGISATWDHRLYRADTLIFLDPPFPVRAWRVLRRTIVHHGRVRPDLPEGCPERFDVEFWSYILRTRRRNRVRMRALVATAGSDVDVHVLRSRHAVDQFSQDVSGQAAVPA